MAARKKQEPVEKVVKKVKLIPEFKDNKELILELLSSDRFDEAIEHIEVQRKYNKFLEFSKCEKNEYGLAKGYVNVFDSSGGTWVNYIKPKLEMKFDGVIINTMYDFKNNRKLKIENIDINNNLFVLQVNSYHDQRASLMFIKQLEDKGLKINYNYCYDVMKDLISAYGNRPTLLERRKVGLYNDFKREINVMDIYYTSYYSAYKTKVGNKFKHIEPNLYL